MIRRHRVFFACSAFAALALFAITSAAEETKSAEYRIWTWDGKKTRVKLALVEQSDSEVKLEREDDGKIFTLMIEKLGEVDQAYLRDLQLTRTLPIAAFPPFLRMGDTATPGHQGMVRALCFTHDSRRLCTAGFDKNVHVWTIEETKTRQPVGETTATVLFKSIAQRGTGTKEGSIFWEIGPGTIGQVYAMAAAPDAPRLAIAGYGYQAGGGGSGGDIVMADPAKRELTNMENDGKGHKQVVTGLAFSADGKWLASHSRDGQILLRETKDMRKVIKIGEENPKTDGPDPREIAAKTKMHAFAAITIRGNNQVAFPKFIDKRGAFDVWNVQLYNIQEKSQTQLPGDLYGEITALAASPKGRYLAAADNYGDLHVWDFVSGRPSKLKSPLSYNDKPTLRGVISLAFGPNENSLIAGTINTGELLEWDLGKLTTTNSPRPKATPVGQPVWACAISPDGNWIAYADGSDVHLESVSKKEKLLLKGTRGITSVGFAANETDYSVIIQNSSGSMKKKFDPQSRKMTNLPAQGNDADQVKDPQGWSVRQEPTADGSLLIVSRNRQPDLKIPMTTDSHGADLHGTMTCHAWIKEKDGKPLKLVVGTAGALGCLFVYDVTDGSLVRAFVGHSGRVNSVAVSPDKRYLVTGSDDGTVRYWPLPDETQSTLLRRWGIELHEIDGKTLLTSIVDTSPLYYRGLRPGDEITRIKWLDQNNDTREVDQFRDIEKQLEQLPWAVLVIFETSRRGRSRESVLQDYPAWKHILAVFPSDSEWIAWNAVGYYDCSANGERLISWQINNKLGQAPSVYDAQQFHKVLHQPDLISGLLAAGNLTGLGEDLLSISNPADARPPRVTIVQPTMDAFAADLPKTTEKILFKGAGRVDKVVREPRVHVKAEAKLQTQKFPVTAMRLLLDGKDVELTGELNIPKTTDKILFKGINGASETTIADWDIELTPGEHVIQVLAETDGGIGRSEMIVKYDDGELEKPPTKRSLYVLAIGISKYPGNPGIGPLMFAHADADQFADSANKYSAPLYDTVHVKRLLNEYATRARILEELETLRKNAAAEDVVMIFYSGHGYRDPKENELFLVSVDGRVGPESNEAAKSCVPVSEITEFCSETRATVVLLLDACHAGGVNLGELIIEQSRDTNGMGWGVFLLVSSTGDEESQERSDWKAGAFTKALIAGWEGKAEVKKDGVIVNDELSDHVYKTVLELTEDAQTPQRMKISGDLSFLIKLSRIPSRE